MVTKGRSRVKGVVWCNYDNIWLLVIKSAHSRWFKAVFLLGYYKVTPTVKGHSKKEKRLGKFVKLFVFDLNIPTQSIQ